MDKKPLKFGLITDIHQDFMYRAEERLEAFINQAKEEQVDFIIQLGDFCFPIPENKRFLELWESFEGPRYHVLGNHDMDICDKKTIMDYIGMERNYYSFDQGEYHFVVLDGNYLIQEGEYIDYSHRNYHELPFSARNNVNEEQIEWLRKDLENTDKHTFIFCHQSLEDPFVGLKNSPAVHSVLKEANEAAGFRKVVACLNGHNHLDGVKVIEDIYFIHVNSSSYFWMAKANDGIRYSEEVMEAYPVLKKSVPYQDSLYAIVTLEPGQMTIDGKESTFVGPSPLESGHAGITAGHVAVPKISSRKLKF